MSEPAIFAGSYFCRKTYHFSCIYDILTLLSLVIRRNRYYCKIVKKKNCCFTGHREISSDVYQTILKKNEEVLECLIKKGYLFFGAGEH